MRGSGRFLKENAFLVAAVSLPVVVVGFFLLASVIPRWVVAPPAYDLLLRAGGPYDQKYPRVAVDFRARNGRVEAIVRPLPPNVYPQPSALLLFDHQTMSVREISVDLPANLAENDPPRTIVIDAFPGRQVLAQAKAPDGYELDIRSRRGPGIIGELFGMGRYDQRASLVNRGRVVPIALPSPYWSQPPAYAVGWLVGEGQP
jgi:hypothetical protein